MASSTPLSPTPRSTVKRGRQRAQTDRATLHGILDSCLICHLATVRDGVPIALPTGYGRDGDTLYLHGSTGAASLRDATGDIPISVTVTRVDGIVYARSSFHHSMNYASAVIIGAATPVTDPDTKLRALQVLTEHLAPGSWAATRPPTRKELAQTAVLALSLDEASVKLRSGPPGDDDDDIGVHGDWAGVLPLRQVWGTPEPCPLLPTDVPVPDRVAHRSPLVPRSRPVAHLY
ncbi:pyridoxamine 5'-phosphate oxidase family protein [Phytoactinopolyspora limicola]|uniref:pyridoxamine 5'-phosphate oxidase family protein n=1 Tax=Phytoactinopolyspora limicola TaxID=2715536 RepID=UPI001409C4C9|nr:pyridoxamine 5'-phosphate oxidase family protein [Phytoactinopolyspora limicola]